MTFWHPTGLATALYGVRAGRNSSVSVASQFTVSSTPRDVVTLSWETCLESNFLETGDVGTIWRYVSGSLSDVPKHRDSRPEVEVICTCEE